MASYPPAHSHPANNQDDEDWEDDPPVELDSGSAGVETTQEGASEVLLELITLTSRLHVLLSEMDAEEIKQAAPRLNLFRRLVKELPTKGKPKARLGFRF